MRGWSLHEPAGSRPFLAVRPESTVQKDLRSKAGTAQAIHIL